MRREAIVVLGLVAGYVIAGLALWAAVVHQTRTAPPEPSKGVGVRPPAQAVMRPSSAPDVVLWVDLPPMLPPVWTMEQERAYVVEQARSRAMGDVDAVLTHGEMVAVFQVAGWPLDWQNAGLTIAHCESRFRPSAVGDEGSSLGVLQLWGGWFLPGEDPFDPLTNAIVGLRVREIRGRFGGPGGWSCADLWGIP